VRKKPAARPTRASTVAISSAKMMCAGTTIAV
jgi:hypothetical protein